MKFVCPRCQAKLNIPAERVPAAGAWARCPKCQDRFFLNVRGADQAREGGPAPPAPASPAGRLRSAAGRTAEEQRLLDRQRAKLGRPKAETSLEGPAGVFEVVVFPTHAPDYRLYGLAAALVVGGFLGLLLHAFQSAGARPDEAVDDLGPPVVNYEDGGLAADLSALRRDFSRRSGLSRNIDYRGREVRVFKYLMAQLAPRACDGEFSSLRLWSFDTGQGFKAVGACLARGETSPELEINWQGEVVLASLAGGRRHLEISPASAGAGEAP
jgi:predicted Zn finger-like uncharacterized protein